MATLGPQLRALRAGAALTQTALAQRISVSQPTVSQVEAGAPTTTDVAERWAEACGGELVALPGGMLTALAVLSPTDRARLARIAASMPTAPEPAKESLTIAFESMSTK